MGAEITETSQEAMFGHLARRHGIWTDLLVGIVTGRYSEGWCDWPQLLGQTEQIVQGRVNRWRSSIGCCTEDCTLNSLVSVLI